MVALLHGATHGSRFWNNTTTEASRHYPSAGQLGGQGETACVVLPAHHHHQTKRRRGELVDDDDDDEGGLAWNLVRDLPYVAFRRLPDFLSSATADAGTPPNFFTLFYSIY